MQTRTMTGHDAEESRRDRTAADGRWMLAIGKRVDHRWVMEMSLGRRHRTLSTGGGGRAAHAA
jgi:hypothetical protein